MRKDDKDLKVDVATLKVEVKELKKDVKNLESTLKSLEAILKEVSDLLNKYKGFTMAIILVCSFIGWIVAYWSSVKELLKKLVS